MEAYSLRGDDEAARYARAAGVAAASPLTIRAGLPFDLALVGEGGCRALGRPAARRSSPSTAARRWCSR